MEVPDFSFQFSLSRRPVAPKSDEGGSLRRRRMVWALNPPGDPIRRARLHLSTQLSGVTGQLGLMTT